MADNELKRWAAEFMGYKPYTMKLNRACDTVEGYKAGKNKFYNLQQWNPDTDRNQLHQVLQKLDEGQRHKLWDAVFSTVSKNCLKRDQDKMVSTMGIQDVFNYFIDTPPAEILRLVREVVEG